MVTSTAKKSLHLELVCCSPPVGNVQTSTLCVPRDDAVDTYQMQAERTLLANIQLSSDKHSRGLKAPLQAERSSALPELKGCSS